MVAGAFHSFTGSYNRFGCFHNFVSGTSARVALQVARGEMALGQKRIYQAAGTGSIFKAGAIKTAEYHG